MTNKITLCRPCWSSNKPYDLFFLKFLYAGQENNLKRLSCELCCQTEPYVYYMDGTGYLPLIVESGDTNKILSTTRNRTMQKIVISHTYDAYNVLIEQENQDYSSRIYIKNTESSIVYYHTRMHVWNLISHLPLMGIELF